MVNSKEIYEEISFPPFLRKMLMSAFLLRFKADYLEKMRGSPSFPLWAAIALDKIIFEHWKFYERSGGNLLIHRFLWNHVLRTV